MKKLGACDRSLAVASSQFPLLSLFAAIFHNADRPRIQFRVGESQVWQWKPAIPASWEDQTDEVGRFKTSLGNRLKINPDSK